MVETVIDKMRMTPKEAETFVQNEIDESMKGIDIIWHQDKPGIMMTKFVSSDIIVAQDERLQSPRGKDDLRGIILNKFKARVVEEDLKSYYAFPERSFTLRAILAHPAITGRNAPRAVKRAADAAKEVQEIELTANQKARIEKETKEKLEYKEKRYKSKEFVTRTPAGEEIRTNEGTEDVYVVEQAIIEQG